MSSRTDQVLDHIIKSCKAQATREGREKVRNELNSLKKKREQDKKTIATLRKEIKSLRQSNRDLKGIEKMHKRKVNNIKKAASALDRIDKSLQRFSTKKVSDFIGGNWEYTKRGNWEYTKNKNIDRVYLSKLRKGELV